MANRRGEEEKLYVADANGNYFEVQGQTGLEIQRNTNTIDQSSKSTGRIAQKVAGREDVTVAVTGKKVVPDVAMDRVIALKTVFPQVSGTFQIRVSPFTTNDVRFQSAMMIANFRESLPDQDNATYSFDLFCTAAPTVDKYAP